MGEGMAMWAGRSTSSCSIGIAHDDDAGSLCLGLSASVAKRPAAAITDNKPTHHCIHVHAPMLAGLRLRLRLHTLALVPRCHYSLTTRCAIHVTCDIPCPPRPTAPYETAQRFTTRALVFSRVEWEKLNLLHIREITPCPRMPC
jgi:hypothetical protein